MGAMFYIRVTCRRLQKEARTVYGPAYTTALHTTASQYAQATRGVKTGAVNPALAHLKYINRGQ